MRAVEKIAQVIRIADGNNTMGAGLLAEHIAAALPDMVVPLDWREEARGYWFADYPMGGRLSVYRAHPCRDGQGWWCYLGDFKTDAFPTPQEAMDAGSADYTRRIMSALGITDKGEA